MDKTWKKKINTKRIIKLAKKGNSDAMYLAGIYYQLHNEPQESFKWFNKAAEQGNVLAQYWIGISYLNSSDCNGVKAFNWLQKAALQGYKYAQLRVGLCYSNGIGTDVDEEKAFEWHLKAAKQGLVNAQLQVGLCYKEGVGIKKNAEESFMWFMHAAEQGSSLAQYIIGLFYDCGFGTVVNEEKAFEWYEKAANQGDSNAQLFLGLCYENGLGITVDDEKAFQWFMKAAEQGSEEAQLKVGLYFEYGLGTEKDEANAFKWYLLAAEHGNPKAQLEVGKRYEDGNGTETNPSKAFLYYVEAAEQDLAEAQRNVGRCYIYSIGTDENDAEAIKWLLKASEQGDSIAQFMVGVLYLDSWKEERENITKGYKWIRESAENGFSLAQASLAFFLLDDKYGFQCERNEVETWIERAISDDNAYVDIILGKVYLYYLNDWRKAEDFFMKASEEDELIDSCNWLSVLCFAEKRNQEGVEWAKKAADAGDALGCFILASAYYHGKGINKNSTDGDFYYKKALYNGLSISPNEAMVLDSITELRLIDIEQLYSNPQYVHSLLSSDFFPKTDFILAKIQKKMRETKDDPLTAESIKGTTTKALSNVLGSRPLLIEELIKKKLKKNKGLQYSDDAIMIGSISLPEYYVEKLETWDFFKQDNPQKYLDYQVYNARSAMDDYWEYEEYKEIKKVFDYYDAQGGANLDPLHNKVGCIKELKMLFPEKKERAIESLYNKVKEEFIRRNSSLISINQEESEEKQPVELKDEETPSAEEEFFRKENQKKRILQLKRFIIGFDCFLNSTVSSGTATVFIIGLLIPSPFKTGQAPWNDKKGNLLSITKWLNKTIIGISVKEIQSILSKTKHFSSNIDWYYEDQVFGEKALKQTEICERLGIIPSAFTRTLTTLKRSISDYWEEHKSAFEDFDD